jgi:integrase
LHDLRHWHLSTLANAGVPMVTVQARGGHSDISTTGIYTHALPEGEERTRGVITAALHAGRP